MQKSLIFWCFLCILGCSCRVTFTNLKCAFKKPSYGVYEKCLIKAVNRTHKYIDIYARFFKKPVDNITANLKVMRNDQGLKPFFVDISFDACRYMKNRQNYLLNMFLNTFQNATNMNHSCPYNHDVIVDKLYTGDHDSAFLKYVPALNGDYAFILTFFREKLEFTRTTVYFQVTN